MHVHVGDTHLCSGLTCWESAAERWKSLEAECPSPAHAISIFLVLQKRASAFLGRFWPSSPEAHTVSATCTLLYLKAAQWSEPRYEPRAGLLWAALLSEAERTKSAQRHGGESEKSLFNLIHVLVHHQSPTPPPHLSSSIPASLLFHSHSFLPFFKHLCILPFSSSASAMQLW